MEENAYNKFITALGNMRQQIPALSYGDYKEQNLTTRQYTFSRSYEGTTVVVMINNDDNACTMQASAPDGTYTGVLSGKKITVCGGGFSAEIAGNAGEIWVPDVVEGKFETVETIVEAPVVQEIEVATEEVVIEENVTEENVTEETPEMVEKSVLDEVAEVAEEQEASKPVEEPKEEKVLDLNKPYEEMSIEELQACILAKMAKNGPVTEEMKRTVDINVHHGSLMNWVRSFQ